jgi:SOS-response transcriptional repressor LexA
MAWVDSKGTRHMLKERDPDSVLRALRVWMRDVMRQKGWTAAEWARRAGTSPTNITRVLAPANVIVPKSSTLALLAEAAGSQPRLAYNSMPSETPAVFVQLLTLEELNSISASNLWTRQMTIKGHARAQIDRPVLGPAFVTAIEDHSMEARGLFAGDRVLVEKPTDIKAGDIILARVRGRVTVAEYRPPLVMFRPSAMLIDHPQMQPVPQTEAEILGRVTRLIRDL